MNRAIGIRRESIIKRAVGVQARNTIFRRSGNRRQTAADNNFTVRLQNKRVNVWTSAGNVAGADNLDCRESRIRAAV